jgi:hypothetical protein
MNVREATRHMGEFRRIAEAEREALLKQYGEAQSAEEQRQLEEARKTVAEAAGPPPQAQQPQQPQQPDPEQQRLQAQANAIAAARQMTDQEIEARREATAIHRWAVQTYSPAVLSGDPNALAHLAQTDPKGYENLRLAGQHFGIHQNTLQQVQKQRYAEAIQVSQARQQQIDAWGAEQDRAAIEAVKKDLPTFTRTDADMDRLRAATRRAMLSTGWSEQQINQMWKSGQLRSVATQRALAKLGGFQLMQEARANLDQHRSKPLPPVSPGVYRPSGADSEADIAALERAVDRARPGSQDQIRAAARLTQALRASGRIQVS